LNHEQRVTHHRNLGFHRQPVELFSPGRKCKNALELIRSAIRSNDNSTMLCEKKWQIFGKINMLSIFYGNMLNSSNFA
jgi:hypothetical protein